MAHITFIHGIGNKPAQDPLLRSWKEALGDADGIELDNLSVSCSMVYWADLMYPAPAEPKVAYETFEAFEQAGVEEVDMSWLADADAEETAMVAGIAAKTGLTELAGLPAREVELPPSNLERIPLPGFLKVRLMSTFLRDVHHYLYNEEFSPRPGESHKIRDVIRSRMVSALAEGAKRPGPHLVVSHSMGTVISYDCLMRVKDCPPVDALITLGSPLGLDEIQDRFKPEWSRAKGFPDKRVHGSWINVYDRLDPVVGLDPNLGNDYEREGKVVIRDIHEPNYGRWRHSISKYLGGRQLREVLSELISS
jgi:hypothetical protein